MLPPGPRTPAAWQLYQWSMQPTRMLDSCGRRFGSRFTLRLAGYGTFVMLSDPGDIKEVFRGSPSVLHSGEANEFLGEFVGRSSVLVLDDQPHARQRHALLPAFKGERMRSYFEDIRDETRKSLARWPLQAPFAADEPMRDITLRVILKAALGDTGQDEFEELVRRIGGLLRYGATRWALIITKLIQVTRLNRLRALPFYREVSELDRLLMPRLAEHRAARAAGQSTGQASILADLLELEPAQSPLRTSPAIVASQANASPTSMPSLNPQSLEPSPSLQQPAMLASQPMSDQEIRDAIMTSLVAGHETTATALAWSLEQILAHPEVEQRIRQELEDVVGAEELQADDLNRLVYLDAVIKESLRIRTIIPFVTRLLKQPFSLGETTYPAGVQLSPCIYLVHRREDLYPRPDEFRPERFLEQRFSSSEWLPFGGGNRICLGMSFALFEMKVVLATLFREARLARPAGARSGISRRGVVLTPSDGVQVVLTERTSTGPDLTGPP